MRGPKEEESQTEELEIPEEGTHVFFSKLFQRLVETVGENYYDIAIITSKAEGLLMGKQRKFGAGKTTFEARLSAILNSRDFPKNIDLILQGKEWEPSEDDWDRVFNRMVYNPVDLYSDFMDPLKIEEQLEPWEDRVPCVVWDDVNYTCPRKAGVPKIVTLVAQQLKGARLLFANLLMSADKMGSISSPLRDLPIFNIVIPQRGWYEVQAVRTRLDFADPQKDWERLDYWEHGPFGILPDHIDDRMNRWRNEQQVRARSQEILWKMRKSPDEWYKWDEKQKLAEKEGEELKEKLQVDPKWEKEAQEWKGKYGNLSHWYNMRGEQIERLENDVKELKAQHKLELENMVKPIHINIDDYKAVPGRLNKMGMWTAARFDYEWGRPLIDRGIRDVYVLIPKDAKRLGE